MLTIGLSETKCLQGRYKKGGQMAAMAKSMAEMREMDKEVYSSGCGFSIKGFMTGRWILI